MTGSGEPPARPFSRRRGVVAMGVLTIATGMLAARVALAAPERSPLKEAEMGVMCMCPDDCGKVLGNCTCGESDDYRAELRAHLDTGMTPQQAVAAYVEKYGRLALSAPTREGFDLLAWTMPFVALFLAIPVVAVVVRRLGGGGSAPAEAEGANEPAQAGSEGRDELDRLLDDELDGMES